MDGRIISFLFFFGKRSCWLIRSFVRLKKMGVCVCVCVCLFYCSGSYVGVESLINKMWIIISEYWKGIFGKTNNDIFFFFLNTKLCSNFIKKDITPQTLHGFQLNMWVFFSPGTNHVYFSFLNSIERAQGRVLKI